MAQAALLALLLCLLATFASCATPGPCVGPIVTINVRKEADVYSRVRWPPQRRVNMLLLNSIALKGSLVFNASFNCTIFYSATPRAFNLSTPDASMPVLMIQGSSNILVYGINFILPITNAYQPVCKYSYNSYGVYLDSWHCPAVWLYGTYAVQVTQGNTYGRIDVVKATQTRVDGMRVWVHGMNKPGGIIVEFCGNGPALQKSNVFITNNEVFAPPDTHRSVGIMIFRGAVGVTVSNNRIHDFTLASLQLGFGQSNVGDAMLNTVSYNDIVHSFGNILGDSAGLYFDTHWVNPGNVVTCNYVRRGGHCIYIDYVSSGITVDGLVCVNTSDGIKINTGKNNVLTGVVVIDSKEPLNAYISCQNADINNCLGPYPATTWVSNLKTYYSTPIFQQLYPWMTNVCKYTSIKGINCNANVTDTTLYGPTATGACSGLPTENYIELVSATSDNWVRNTNYFCSNYPAVPSINTMKSYWTSVKNASFVNAAAQNYGLRPGSPLPSVFPRFRSCPSTKVGPQPNAGIGSYFPWFNLPLPRASSAQSTMLRAARANAASPTTNPFLSPHVWEKATPEHDMVVGFQ